MEAFFDYEETLRRLGLKPPSKDYRKEDEVWYDDYVSFGIVLWPPYIVMQSRDESGEFATFKFKNVGWRYDQNARKYIAPVAAWQSGQTRPVHRGY